MLVHKIMVIPNTQEFHKTTGNSNKSIVSLDFNKTQVTYTRHSKLRYLHSTYKVQKYATYIVHKTNSTLHRGKYYTRLTKITLYLLTIANGRLERVMNFSFELL